MTHDTHLRPLLILFLVASLASLPMHAETAAIAPEPFSEEISSVERIRGLEFPRAVTHRTLARSDLRDYLERIWRRDLPLEPHRYFEILEALHLIDEMSGDPLDALLDLYVDQVLAFYDPIEDIFYSLDQPPERIASLMTSSFERAITVHELMHALQNQLHDAGGALSERRDDWDSSLAYHALMEGEAMLVMLSALVEELGGSLEQVVQDDQVVTALAAAAQAEIGGAGGAPSYFVESMKFPYVSGLDYVIRLYREGGWEAVDRAHLRPPTTTREIYRGDAGRAPVAGLEIDDILLETTFGEFHWRFLLGADVAAGWRGDRIQVVGGGEGYSVVVATQWDAPQTAASFEDAYGSFLRDRGERPLIFRDEHSVRVGYGADRPLLRRTLSPPDPVEEP
jgi:hypothetical protein